MKPGSLIACAPVLLEAARTTLCFFVKQSGKKGGKKIANSRYYPPGRGGRLPPARHDGIRRLPNPIQGTGKLQMILSTSADGFSSQCSSSPQTHPNKSLSGFLPHGVSRSLSTDYLRSLLLFWVCLFTHPQGSTGGSVRLCL